MFNTVPKSIFKLFYLSFVLVGFFSITAVAQEKSGNAPSGKPVLWRDPGDIAARDLTYGPGSVELGPQPPFTFIEEDKGGASPKFRVKDARGVTWNVKLGVESQAETVVTRLIWAAGYFAEESYYLETAEIAGLPKLSRGGEFVTGTTVRGARFEPRRDGVNHGGNWDWRENPFAGTRELDGLKVLMVLLANYDTTPDNNRILSVTNSETGQIESRYVVHDLGATLGRVGGLGGKRTKNDLEDFAASKFVVEVKDGMVEFDYKTRPQKLGLVTTVLSPGYRSNQIDKEKAMRRIPVGSVRWIGTMLSGLTDEQIRIAFRAAGYNDATTEGYTRALRARIDQLTRATPSDIEAVKK